MPLDLSAPTPLGYFKSLVHSDAQFPLLEAAAALAQDETPDLDVQQVLGEVDQMLARVRRRLPPDTEALERLRALNLFFFHELGFAGNVNHYHDPGNSYLDQVLRTRRGIPISLAVIWLELATGLGLDAQGVSFPGHFMVKVALPPGQVVIDPFTGESLGRDELWERLEPFRPPGLRGREDADIPLGLYLQSASAREIIARMLRNLKEIHRSRQDWPRMTAVLDRLVILLPQAWNEVRDRGLVLAEQGLPERAVRDLEAYVRNAPDDALDIDAVVDELARLRRAMS